MQSVWMQVDKPRRERNPGSSRMGFSRSVPYLGVFTDEPAKIVRRLGRPKTPFVPAPAPSLRGAALWVEPVPVDSPAEVYGGYGSPEFGVSFF
jgi:hypothetical protein